MSAVTCLPVYCHLHALLRLVIFAVRFVSFIVLATAYAIS